MSATPVGVGGASDVHIIGLVHLATVSVNL